MTNSNMVQAITWNHHIPQVLLSGSVDHTVVMCLYQDIRIPSHTDEFQPMLEVWHEIHTMSTQLWLVSKMVPLMVLISELQNLIIFLGQSRVSLFMHTRKPNVKLWALSTNQPCVVSKNPNARKQFL
ncbi:uncharacterized protein LOC130758097 isoform X1 [Actinidia eriantha]|uniref:uncharacterized protein LOC130758097 isoform X1 n=1 Tax=Actinidia eriantha TaxID=165200 RepID=UPI00258314C1|nr:uncharacterized protein LOC130758097 isoform X1 [Actinidia eriantha]